MQKTIWILLLLLFPKPLPALNIRDVFVSVNSTNSINVGVNTEAAELYYFHSAQYTILGNAITVEACYVSGFGSAIEFLNNNFEIPIDTEQAANYTLTVKIYYTDLQVFYQEQSLQDEITGMFAVPLSGAIILGNTRYEQNNISLFPNPVNHYLMFSETVNTIVIYDMAGRIIRSFTEATNSIDLSDIQSGLYFIDFLCKEGRFRKMIVKQ